MRRGSPQSACRSAQNSHLWQAHVLESGVSDVIPCRAQLQSPLPLSCAVFARVSLGWTKVCTPLQVQQFVHPASGAGLLAAIRGVAVAAVAGNQSAEGTGDEGSRAVAAHTAAEFFAAADLGAAERNQLREFLLQVQAAWCLPVAQQASMLLASIGRIHANGSLQATSVLQERWFASGDTLPPAAIITLKQLPIFRCGAPLPQSPAGEPASTDQSNADRATAAQMAAGGFTSLASASQALPPAGTPEALLSPDHLVAGSSQEAAILLSHLGVPQLDAVQFAAQHMVPHAAALPAGPRDAALVALLRSLSDAPAELRQTLSEVGTLTCHPDLMALLLAAASACK
jgi:hypothetical protein